MQRLVMSANSDDEHPRGQLLDRVNALGGLQEGVARQVSEATRVPEAEVYGVASFYHLLSRPDAKLRVCTGLTCALGGATDVLAAAKAAGLPVEEVSCLAACDRPPAVLRGRRVLPQVTVDDIARAKGEWTALRSAALDADPALRAGAPETATSKTEPTDAGEFWRGTVGPARDSSVQACDLLGEQDYNLTALDAARKMGTEAFIDLLETSGLQGRGGAGFPAFLKWRSVAGQAETKRYVVMNADEGEPATFKDREVMLRRPDRIIEGLAIAAEMIGAVDIYLYLRGEFQVPWEAIEAAIARFGDRLGHLNFHLHAGHGAYICGEETALLEALEGRRGMPRHKPPYPTEAGLWGKPTLMHNVETIALVPALVAHGGQWFRALGRSEAGSKLYCVSGHVQRPGTYELPLGVTLDELVEAAGGYVGELKAFSPGGASSGFLPASDRNVPLDFKTLADRGSMLGSAGVVVLNTDVDMVWAVREQMRFFEDESCGQCAPCRIGTRFLRERLDAHLKHLSLGTTSDALANVSEAAWEMIEGSICGLGQAAPLPLTSALTYFPEEFRR